MARFKPHGYGLCYDRLTVVVTDDGYEYQVDDDGYAIRRRPYEGTPNGIIRRKCRGCGLLLVIRRGRQRFVRAPYIWAGKAFCNSCASVREQQDDNGLPWEELRGSQHPEKVSQTRQKEDFIDPAN
jgi:hypothetical protein